MTFRMTVRPAVLVHLVIFISIEHTDGEPAFPLIRADTIGVYPGVHTLPDARVHGK
jgi:hypothetical protein